MIYEIKDLTFSYNSSRTIFNKVNLDIKQGDLISFLGKNGSGKSTLFTLLMGLNKKYDGSIKLDGKEIKDLKEREIALISGLVPQSTNSTFGFSVYEYVLMGLASKYGMFGHPTKKDEEYVLNMLDKMNLLEFKDREYSELSGGEKQQVTITRALVGNPKILIFDEPCAHLDYANQLKVLKTIKELHNQGYTILFSTHDPNHCLMLESDVAMLDGKGNINKGSCEEMITEECLSKIYGSDIKIRYIEEFKCRRCIYTI